MADHYIFQGAVYWLKLSYDGYEDRTRPYMVVSNNACNRRAADINVIQLSNNEKRLDLPCNVPLGELVRKGENTIARCSVIKTIRRDQLSIINWACNASEEQIEAVKAGLAAQLTLQAETQHFSKETVPTESLHQQINDLQYELECTRGMLRAALADLQSICEDSGDGCQFCEHYPCVITGSSTKSKCLGWHWKQKYIEQTSPFEPWAPIMSTEGAKFPNREKGI